MTAQRQQLDIDLSPIFEALEGPLALVDSPERRDEMQRFANASRGYQERAIFDLLSRLTQTVNDAHTGAELRLEYRNGGLALSVEAERVEEPEEPVMRMDTGELDRLTLRVPQRIKQEIDRAADEQGVSVNHWCIQALGRVAFRQTRGRMEDPAAAPRDRERGPWRGRRNRIVIETDGPGFPDIEALRRHGAVNGAFEAGGIFGRGRGRQPRPEEPGAAPDAND